MTRILGLLFLVLAMANCSSPPKADLVVYGRTWTGNPLQAWAEGFAVRGDSIVVVGSRSEIEQYQGGETLLVEVPQGGMVVPGFIDAHTHFVDGGFRLSSVQLRDAKTREEFIDRIKKYALTQKPGVWITGGDWDHENWGGELPSKEWIDSVSTTNPVWINRLDGHMALANSAALFAAGIGDNVKDVPGGTIVRTRGKITGVFKDNAQYYIEKAVPPPTSMQEDRALDTAMRYVASNGVTSVHHMSGYYEALRRAHGQGRLTTRIYAGHALDDWRTLANEISKNGRGDKWLRIGSLKAFVDGSLGSHTAAFFKPFDDAPSDSGFLVTEKNRLANLVHAADSAGLHLMVHAIGDRAIRTLLDIYQQVALQNGERDRRFRIEHAQHIHPNDVARFRDLNVIASMQPYHVIDDGRWAEKVIGPERSKTTYAFRALLDSGAQVAFGSDWFVAPPTPLEGIYAAVTRRTLDGKKPEGWVPAQKISVEEALRAYTVNAAYASFEESIKGSLATGKLADFVILEKDITQINPVEIRDVKVLATGVGGRIVFEKK